MNNDEVTLENRLKQNGGKPFTVDLHKSCPVCGKPLVAMVSPDKGEPTVSVDVSCESPPNDANCMNFDALGYHDHIRVSRMRSLIVGDIEYKERRQQHMPAVTIRIDDKAYRMLGPAENIPDDAVYLKTDGSTVDVVECSHPHRVHWPMLAPVVFVGKTITGRISSDKPNMMLIGNPSETAKNLYEQMWEQTPPERRVVYKTGRSVGKTTSDIGLAKAQDDLLKAAFNYPMQLEHAKAMAREAIRGVEDACKGLTDDGKVRKYLVTLRLRDGHVFESMTVQGTSRRNAVRVAMSRTERDGDIVEGSPEIYRFGTDFAIESNKCGEDAIATVVDLDHEVRTDTCP